MRSPTVLAKLRLRGESLSLAFASALPALLFGYAGYQRRWAGDDGFINLRVVHQLTAGNGFVYNAGERTEAVTSPAWVLVLWLFGELGADLEQTAWVLGLTLGVLGLWLAALASARLSRPDAALAAPSGSLILPFGVVGYCALPAAWDYATSALENGIGLAFLGTSYWLLARMVTSPEARWHRSVAAFVGLAPLLRPDYSLYAAPLILVLLSISKDWRTRGSLLLAAAAPGVAFQIFRMGYFACLVPNTAIAKEAFASHWDQGLHYLENTVGTYWLLWPLSCCALALVVLLLQLARAGLYRRASVALAMALAGAFHILYVVRLGGDFMHGRMLLPGLFALFASVGVLRVSTKHSPGLLLGVAGTLSLVAWGAYCARTLRPEMIVHHILDERRWYAQTAGTPHPVRVSDYAHHQFYTGPLSLRARIAATCRYGDDSLRDEARDVCPRIAWPEVADGKLADHPEGIGLPLEPTAVAPFVLGVIGFRPLGIAGVGMGLRINLTDSYGLADALASRMEQGVRGRPGHEKFFTTPWFAAKYIVAGATLDERVITARRVLQCGLLRELHAATHEPLTGARFLRNMRLSFALHGLRIPTDPHVAERRFCRT
jgi:arabinofuranosyltransferase